MKKLFISYSRRDIQTAERIHLTLENAEFEVWRDTARIEPAMNWSREAANGLSTSDAVILLWSSEAARSPVVKHEWLTARALGKGIIPCFLEPLKNLPIEARLPQPIENINGLDFTDFEKGIKVLIQNLKNPSSIDTRYDYLQLPPHSFIPFRPNPSFVGRQTELVELYLSVIGGLNVIGINQTVSLFGLGGIGKTQLAVEFANRFAFAFPDGVWWLNAARDWKSEFISLAHKLGLSGDYSLTGDADRILLHKLQGFISEHKSGLLLMDNIADPSKLDDEVIEGFVPASLGCTLVFTSKSQKLPIGGRALEVKVLDDLTAFQLLTRDLPPISRDEERFAYEICLLLGYLPLALELAGTYLKKKKGIVTYEVYMQNIQQRRLQILEQKKQGIRLATHDPSLLATFESQYQLIVNKDAQLLFKLSGQFPEAEIIPIARLGLLAGIEDHPGVLNTPLHDAFNELIEISLAEQLQDNQIRLHPLVWEFAKSLILEKERTQLIARAVTCLCNAYNDPLRLGDEYVQRGIDSIIEDVNLAVDWSEFDTSFRRKLTELLSLLDHQRHNLRPEFGSNTRSILTQEQLFQQLHYGSYNKSFADLSQKFLNVMTSSSKPCFKAYGEETIEDSYRIRTFMGSSDAVRAVNLSSDGKLAISGSKNSAVILWDVESAKPIRTFNRSLGAVCFVSLNGKGDQAISGSQNGIFALWDVETGELIRTFGSRSSKFCTMGLSSDGKRAISSSGNKTLTLWDVENGESIRTFKGHSRAVRSVCLSSDGNKAVSGSDDKTLILWDVDTGEPIRTFSGHSGTVRSVCFGSDGKRAISGSEDKTLILWDMDTGEPIRTFRGHSGAVRVVSLSGDGKRAISGSDDKTLILWDVDTGEPIRTFSGHSSAVWSVALSNDGKRAVSGSDDQTLIYWDVGRDKSVRTFRGHSGTVRVVSLSNDGKRAISGSEDKTLTLWDVENGGPIRTFKTHSGDIWCANLSGNGKLAIGGSRNCRLTLWDVDTGEPIRTFRGHSGAVRSVCFSSDGKRAISGSEDKTLILWDMDTGEPIRTFRGHSGAVRVVSLSGDGKRAISGSEDKTLILWDVDTGEPIRTFGSRSGKVYAMSLSVDGKRAISSSDDKKLTLWDVETGEPIRIFMGHTGNVCTVCFSSDDKRVLSGSWDKTLILWDMENGNILRRLYVEGSRIIMSYYQDKVVFAVGTGSVQFLQIIG